MKKRANFNRKRPLILPPLTDLQPTLRPMDPLQPPDLLLAANRVGSPAPRRHLSKKYNDTDTCSNREPIIKIFEPPSEEIETSNSSSDKSDSLLFLIKKRNSFNMCEFESKKCDRENIYGKNRSRKHVELKDDLSKIIKSQKIPSLEEPENLKNLESKNLWIPNRYKPLKPIDPDKVED